MARNSQIAPNVARLGRTKAYQKKGGYKFQQRKGAAKKEEETPAHKEVPVKGAKNGGKRLVPTQKAPRFYPSVDAAKPKASRKVNKPTKLKSNITPGSVLILLAGRFRGKRVVFLKQLDSGLLLVTGPSR